MSPEILPPHGAAHFRPPTAKDTAAVRRPPSAPEVAFDSQSASRVFCRAYFLLGYREIFLSPQITFRQVKMPPPPAESPLHLPPLLAAIFQPLVSSAPPRFASIAVVLRRHAAHHDDTALFYFFFAV